MTLKDIEQRNFSWLQLGIWPFGDRVILTDQAKHRLACLYGFAYGASLIRKEFAEKLIADFHASIDNWIKRSIGNSKESRYRNDDAPLYTYPTSVCKLSDDGSFLSFTFQYMHLVQVEKPDGKVISSLSLEYLDFPNGKAVPYNTYMYGGLIYHGPKSKEDILNNKLDSSYNYWGMHT